MDKWANEFIKLSLTKETLEWFDQLLKAENISRVLFRDELTTITCITGHYYSKIYEPSLQTASDLLSNQPIDKAIANIWNTLLPLTFNKNKLWEQCFEIRNNVIKISKLNENIRAGFVAVFWNYGDVAVLRGNPTSLLSSVQDNPLERHEVSLRYPFENNGEFCSLDLSQEDTIVIGPSNKLKPYVTNQIQKIKNAIPAELFPNELRLIIADYIRPIQTFCFEEMNRAQLKFFEVPVYLHPQKKIALEKMDKVLNKQSERIKSHAVGIWKNYSDKSALSFKENQLTEKADNFRKKYLNKTYFTIWKTKSRSIELQRYLERIAKEKIEKSRNRCVIM